MHEEIISLLRSNSSLISVVVAVCGAICTVWIGIGNSLSSLISSVLYLFLLLLSGGLFTLWHKQRSLLYQPCPPSMMETKKLSGNQHGFRSPGEPCWRIPFKDCNTTTVDGVKIAFWFMYQPKSSQAYTWLYFHGNAGNIGHRLENYSDIYHKLGVNIVAVDYRGFGDSDDVPISEGGLIRDAQAILDWCLDPDNGIDPRKLIVFGRSLGGAVAIALAHHNLGKHAFAAIILENTFVSTCSMASALFPMLKWVVDEKSLGRWIVKDTWFTRRRLTKILHTRTKTLFCMLSGTRDEIVPPSQMDELILTIKRYRQEFSEQGLDGFHRFRSGHNDTPQRGGAEYWDALKKFHETLAKQAS